MQIMNVVRDVLVGSGAGNAVGAAWSAGPLVTLMWLVGIGVRAWFLASMLRLAWGTSFGRMGGGDGVGVTRRTHEVG